MLDFKPKPTRALPAHSLACSSSAAVIGIVSSLVAAGGGFLSIPFMVFCNVTIHQAVGTSAALGFPIAVAGHHRLPHRGWKATGLPAGSARLHLSAGPHRRGGDDHAHRAARREGRRTACR
jgi:uncharacterized membrane protein YfcA